LLGLGWRAAPVVLDEEAYLLGEPRLAAASVALAKVQASDPPGADEIIVSADTLVVSDADILGKPTDAEQARTMLRRLRARPHRVLTGIALRSAEAHWLGVVDTRVQMRSYSDADIEAYVMRGEPFDKAGGYAVQDDTFRPVEELVGCYLNVVGLPLCAVSAGLATAGVTVEAAGPPPCGYCARGALLVRS
jgi:MAF protein